MLADYSSLATIIVTGIIILGGFILIRLVRTLLSFSFIGFALALYSYLICDYFIYDKLPIISTIALIMCLIGVTKSGIVKKIFAIIGIIIAVMNILTAFEIAF